MARSKVAGSLFVASCGATLGAAKGTIRCHEFNGELS